MNKLPYQKLKEYLHADVCGLDHRFTWDRVIRRYIKNPNIRFIFWWRIASYLFQKGGKRITKRAYKINRKLTARYGIELELGAEIAEGITFAHTTGVVISRSCIIGKNFHIRQNATIGVKSNSHLSGGKIILGDNVTIGANACIIGDNLRIGNNVTIGAMAFVNQDIPDDAVCYTSHTLCVKSA